MIALHTLLFVMGYPNYWISQNVERCGMNIGTALALGKGGGGMGGYGYTIETTHLYSIPLSYTLQHRLTAPAIGSWFLVFNDTRIRIDGGVSSCPSFIHGTGSLNIHFNVPRPGAYEYSMAWANGFGMIYYEEHIMVVLPPLPIPPPPVSTPSSSPPPSMTPPPVLRPPPPSPPPPIPPAVPPPSPPPTPLSPVPPPSPSPPRPFPPPLISPPPVPHPSPPPSPPPPLPSAPLPIPPLSSPTPPPHVPPPSPSPPPLPTPPFSSPPTPPPNTLIICDVCIIGCGVAGATAFVTLGVHACMVCPELHSSTSVASGYGQFLIPSIASADADVMLNELNKYANQYDVQFERERAHHFIQKSREIETVLSTKLNITFRTVPAFEDVHQTSCTRVPDCCTDGVRYIEDYGNYSCDESQYWFKESNCCEHRNNTLNVPISWPTYLDVRNLLDGKVVQPAKDNQLISTFQLIQEFANSAQHNGGRFFKDTIVDAIDTGNDWMVYGDNYLFKAHSVIFASGGFGKYATRSELDELKVYSTSEVHAHNSGILWNISKRNGWQLDPLNAWYLEYMNGQEQWFLWHPKSTVISFEGQFLYDESASYDERGRIRKRLNNTAAYYLYEDTNSDVNVSTLFPTLQQNSVPKNCNTLSKRLWRNFLSHAGYSGNPLVGKSECSSRVSISTPVRINIIKQGMIDTICGPTVDVSQKIISARNAYTVGNAASPGFSRFYVGPGSTLGNALVTGFIAAKALLI